MNKFLINKSFWKNFLFLLSLLSFISLIVTFLFHYIEIFYILFLSLPEALLDTFLDKATFVESHENDDKWVVNKSNPEDGKVNISGNTGNNINTATGGSTVTGNTNTTTNLEPNPQPKNQSLFNILVKKISNTFLTNSILDKSLETIETLEPKISISGESTSSSNSGLTITYGNWFDYGLDENREIFTTVESLKTSSSETTAAVENFNTKPNIPANSGINTNPTTPVNSDVNTNSTTPVNSDVNNGDLSPEVNTEVNTTDKGKGKSLVKKLSSIFKSDK